MSDPVEARQQRVVADCLTATSWNTLVLCGMLLPLVASMFVLGQLVQEFFRLVHSRQGTQLDSWISKVEASNVAELQRFANGLERDKAAVLAGLTLVHSNGQVEGQVTRIKLIKRMMFGRAGFALLRQRVLHAL